LKFDNFWLFEFHNGSGTKKWISTVANAYNF